MVPWIKVLRLPVGSAVAGVAQHLVALAPGTTLSLGDVEARLPFDDAFAAVSLVRELQRCDLFAITTK